ncbi:MAG: DUF58 domain-containing protein [Clostridia bacterium]|nr:DUF58 domain-containing protein [Clostridia bacterium]
MNNKNRRIKLLPGSILYFALLIFAILFTQLLRNPVSNAFLWFVLLLPIVSVVHTLIGKGSIQIFVHSDTARTEKGEPVEYEIKIVNSSILTYPFVEAVISEPSDESLKCKKRRMNLSLVPFGTYTVKKAVRFRFRGLYEIGVESVYISDLFRFFALRADMYNYAPVTVFPRKIPISGQRTSSDTDVPQQVIRRDITNEKTDVSDIRDYVAGDSIRDIHWKLSSKTQEIKVKQFNSAEENHVYVFCDVSRAAIPEKKSASEVYDSLKKMFRERKEKGRSEQLRRSIIDNMGDAETDADDRIGSILNDVAADPEKKSKKKNKASGSKKMRKSRKRERKERKLIRSGMDKNEIDTIIAIDDLIRSNSKKKKKAVIQDDGGSESSAREAEARTERVTTLESDIRHITDLIGNTADELNCNNVGGEVRPEFSEEYDELCADAVIERTIAEAFSEFSRGRICTVCWFDEREDCGIASYTVRSESEFEEVYMKLATASTVDHENLVSKLSICVSDSASVVLKVVTSNLDPVSASEISSLPARFGGAGTGCSAEIFVYSPFDKYTDPTARKAYVSSVCADLMRRGIMAMSLDEEKDSSGAAVYVATSVD